MLRPEQMSRVSVTGSKSVMEDVVEAMHDLDLLHLSEYDGGIEGFSPGTSMSGADSVSDKLVTVRAIESILDVEEGEAGTQQYVTDEQLDEELATVREEVNELDDQREEIQDELRSVEESIQQLSLFVDLGIDLDLLDGYENLDVAVGQGDPDAVEAALADSTFETYGVFHGEEAVAVFVYDEEPGDLDDVLVGASFTRVEVPDGSGDPTAYLEELHDRKDDLESHLEDIETELDDLREEVVGFLLAAEEQLTIEAQKREAPLSFATTANAFIAEGWIPSDEVAALQSALTEAAGDRVEVEELERASYDEDGNVHDQEPIAPEGAESTTGTEADEESEESEPPRAAADGGVVTLSDDSPPVVQDNPSGVKPFEALVEIINRPRYTELDPTVILFLTFPAFFGFMIGDLGYGLAYMGLGYYLLTNFDNDVVKSLGGIGLWAGGFTALFGILYGEIFGLHQLGDILWSGHPPIHKGLQPHYIKYAQAWLLVSIVVAVLHLVVGRIFDFVNNYNSHGLEEAVFESGSWILMTVGMWMWVFSTQYPGPKPAFMFEVLSSGEEAALPLGFTGFSPVELFTIPVIDQALSLWLGLFLLGLVMAIVAEGGIAIIESITQAFGHVISYTRLAAVLLAKAGMALAVNLLVFGATLHEGEFHLIFFAESYDEANVVFQGLFNMDGATGLVIGLVFGIIVLLVGHLLVLVLGITSAGLQAVRLEYVEFFGKFYEGGGTPYSPFGYERTYTTDD